MRLIKLGALAVFAVACSAACAGELLLKPQEAQTGLVKYSKKIPQCSGVKSVKNGPLQTLDYGFGKIDVLYEVSGKKLISVTLNGTDGAKNDGQMRAMMCATSALLMASQPKYQTVDEALKNSTHLWKSSVQKLIEIGRASCRERV